MARTLRIPGLIDIVRTDAPEDIVTFANDPRLDRGFEANGPMANRLIVGRIRRVLRLNGLPLPPVAPRGAPWRAQQQTQLEAMLRPDPGNAAYDEILIGDLGERILTQAGKSELGPLAQTLAGRIFVPDFQGTVATWDAAVTLDAAVRSFNPIRRIVWALTGQVRKARTLLASGIKGHSAGLHAIGIAIHNLVRSLERMRDLANERDALVRFSPAQAASICLAAPDSVVRQAVGPGMSAAGLYRRGTLVQLQLEAARARTLRPDLAFMTVSWSKCPAHAWVPGLLSAVWESAQTLHRSGGPPSRKAQS